MEDLDDLGIFDMDAELPAGVLTAVEEPEPEQPPEPSPLATMRKYVPIRPGSINDVLVKQHPDGSVGRNMVVDTSYDPELEALVASEPAEVIRPQKDGLSRTHLTIDHFKTSYLEHYRIYYLAINCRVRIDYGLKLRDIEKNMMEHGLSNDEVRTLRTEVKITCGRMRERANEAEKVLIDQGTAIDLDEDLE